MNSPEYNNWGKNDRDYVGDLYRILLDREGDQKGQDAWVDVAASGVSRKYLANKFVCSEEFTLLCDRYQVTRGELMMTEPRDMHTKIAALVVSHYESCLGRYPSASEINHWVEEVVDSYLSTLVYGVFDSSEYISRKRTNEEFVDDVYQAVLLRQPDPSKSTWINKLEKGSSRDSILKGFITSEEFKAISDNCGVEPCKKHRFPRAVEVLDEVGWTLRAAYEWSMNLKYFGTSQGMPNVPDNGSDWFADYGWNYHKGNCYTMAGTFYQMAIELGYEAYHIYGHIPHVDGTYSRHSWCEIKIDGTTYVFDPQFEWKTGKTGWYIYYGKSGTWRYVVDGIMGS